MREIKFRGKRIDNGEWVYGDIVHHYENQRVFIACDQLAYTYTECGINRLVFERYHEVIPETVGQFTGLHDKNGKEIYEGDIVKCVSLENDHNQRGAVTTSEVGYWMGNACLLITRIPIYPFSVTHTIEVISNTYENPEPLGG